MRQSGTMIRIKKAAACFLAAAFVLTLASGFASCGRRDGRDGQTDPTDDAQGAFDWTGFVIITPGSGLPQEYDEFGQSVNLFARLRIAVEEVSGSSPEYDFSLSERREHEIIIGDTDREESVSLRDELGEKDYVVAYRNGSFVIWGGCDDALKSALKSFIAMIPVLKKDLAEGDLVRHIVEVTTVYLNGVDIRQYKFSSVKDVATPYSQYFAREFEKRFGYSLVRTSYVYEAYRDTVTSPNSRYIVFGYGAGFADDAPEAEPGTAVVLCNGSSIMIYAGEGETGLDSRLIKLIESTPTVNGEKHVEIPAGVTRLTGDD